MSIAKKETEYTANLARLGLSEEEKDLFTIQLNDILGYIDIINSVDTKDTPPAVFYGPGGRPAFKTPLREDKTLHSDASRKIMSVAPKQEDNMFRVPRILETEE